MGLESEHQLWGPWTTIMETESEQNSNSTNGSSSSGGSSRPQIAQMSLYERQAVQALQALQRQPNAAQYFHQFMLQQQLSNAQLHSLAAVQQATIAASRQASSPNTSTAQQQTTTSQASINLATTSAAQLISRSQSVSSPSATTLTQSVLLGNTTSPPLNQSQAQMYLRVNRTLGRNVPLASQLILMPNGAVAAVQQEGAICSVSGSSYRCRPGQWQPLDLWMGTGEDEGNHHRPGPTLLLRDYFSGFLFFSPLFLISAELESLVTVELFELGTEVVVTENSPAGLGSCILHAGQISLHS
uniref:Polyhomeotic homolog 1 n=1 Tax=Canis lupus familiaris TaxID=9615 RepID=A0A8C0NFL5_CANLF